MILVISTMTAWAFLSRSLSRSSLAPFDDPGSLYELKYEGFRALPSKSAAMPGAPIIGKHHGTVAP